MLSCPKCNHQLTGEVGYPRWCEQCNHGVLEEQFPQTPIEKMYAVMGKKSGRQLFERFQKQQVLKPRFSFRDRPKRPSGSILTVFLI